MSKQILAQTPQVQPRTTLVRFACLAAGFTVRRIDDDGSVWVGKNSDKRAVAKQQRRPIVPSTFNAHQGVKAETVAEGGCICGAIRYRVSGQPTNSMICHCQTCRRVAASPVVAWVTFPAAQFQYLQGYPSEFHSSRPVRARYGACGTPHIRARRFGDSSTSPRAASILQNHFANPSLVAESRHRVEYDSAMVCQRFNNREMTPAPNLPVDTPACTGERHAAGGRR
jgi:hypothetical protein